MLQLEAFSLALEKLAADVPRPKLQFVGSCRNESDEERLQKLKDRAAELQVDGDVEFYKNAMYRCLSRALYGINYSKFTQSFHDSYLVASDCRKLVELLGNAVAGMHGMIDEHFGISIVEYMAAGAIPIGQTLRLVESDFTSQFQLLLAISLMAPLFFLVMQLTTQPDPKWTLCWKKMDKEPGFLLRPWRNTPKRSLR